MNKISLLFLILFFAVKLSAQTDPRITQLERLFQRAEQNGFSGSVLVAEKGSVLLSKGYGWQDREAKTNEQAGTVFCIGSITKQFTAAAILVLMDQKKLRTEDLLSKYFPDAPADKRNITLHQLLTHAAGFPDAIGDDYEYINADDFAKLALSVELQSKPGAEYHYSNVGYSLLGIIVEKVSGQSFEQFLQDNLFKPAGMTKTGYLLPGHKPADLAVGYRDGNRWGTALDHPWGADGPGWHLRANGGILSTTEDMYRWFQALGDKKILSAAARKKYWAKNIQEDESGKTWYGYGWVVEDIPALHKTMYWHNGGNGVFNAYMGFEPETGLCVIISSNSNDKITDQYADIIVNQIIPGLYQPMSDEQVKSWSGVYKLPSGETFQVNFDELDRLHIPATTPALFKLLVGNGDENQSESDARCQRSLLAVQQMMLGNFKPFAEARKVPEDVVRRNQSAMWKELQDKNGMLTGLEIVGNAARPSRNLNLTVLKLIFQRGTQYMTLIWKDDIIDDFRLENKLDKVFDPEGNGHFAAQVNKKIVQFNADGSLDIEGMNGKTHAIR